MYLGVHYRLKTGKFTFTPGLSFHAYSNQNTQLGNNFKDNFFDVLPDFEALIQFKKSETLTFNYRMQNTFTDVTNIAEGLVLNNFNSFFLKLIKLILVIYNLIEIKYFPRMERKKGGFQIRVLS